MQTNIRRQAKAGSREKSSWRSAKVLQHRVQQRKTVKDFRRSLTAQLDVVSQSGTNDWRGRAYGFLRSQRLDARNPLSTAPDPRDPGKLLKDPLTQAQYGATMGGPILRKRTFLFANFEQTRLNNSVVVTISPADVTAINSVLDQIRYAGPRISTGLTPTGYDTTNFFSRVDHHINATNLLTARFPTWAFSRRMNGARSRA